MVLHTHTSTHFRQVCYSYSYSEIFRRHFTNEPNNPVSHDLIFNFLCRFMKQFMFHSWNVVGCKLFWITLRMWRVSEWLQAQQHDFLRKHLCIMLSGCCLTSLWSAQLNREMTEEMWVAKTRFINHHTTQLFCMCFTATHEPNCTYALKKDTYIELAPKLRFGRRFDLFLLSYL